VTGNTYAAVVSTRAAVRSMERTEWRPTLPWVSFLLLFPQGALHRTCFFWVVWVVAQRVERLANRARGYRRRRARWAHVVGTQWLPYIFAPTPEGIGSAQRRRERAVVVTSRVIVVHSPPCPATTPPCTPISSVHSLPPITRSPSPPLCRAVLDGNHAERL